MSLMSNFKGVIEEFNFIREVSVSSTALFCNISTFLLKYQKQKTPLKFNQTFQGALQSNPSSLSSLPISFHWLKTGLFVLKYWRMLTCQTKKHHCQTLDFQKVKVCLNEIWEDVYHTFCFLTNFDSLFRYLIVMTRHLPNSHSFLS